MNGISYFEVSSNNRLELADKIKSIFREKTYTFFQTVKRILSNVKRLFSGGRTKPNNDIT